MIRNNMYGIESGPFNICSSVWDVNNNIFRPANSTEKNKCCLRTCIPFIRECHHLCLDAKNKKFCELTCKDIQNSCIDYCDLSNENLWGVNNPIYKATKEYGCGDGTYHPINQQCMKENKNNIISLCQKQCIQTSEVDCTNHCKYSYDFISDPTHNYFKRSGESTVKKAPYKDKKLHGDRRYFLYIVYSTVLSIILILLFLLFNRRYR